MTITAPGGIAPEQFQRLPRYAQDALTTLQRDLDKAHAALTAGAHEAPARVVAHGQPDTPVGTPGRRLRVQFGTHNQDAIDVTWFEGALRVTCEGKLTVFPDGNAITVTNTEPEAFKPGGAQ